MIAHLVQDLWSLVVYSSGSNILCLKNVLS